MGLRIHSRTERQHLWERLHRLLSDLSFTVSLLCTHALRLHMKAVHYSNWPCHEQKKVGKAANKNISLRLSFISCCCWVITISSSFLCRGSLSRSSSRCLHNNKYFCQTVKTVEQSQKQNSSFIRIFQTFTVTSEMLLHGENPHSVILHLILLYQTLYVLKLLIT